MCIDSVNRLHREDRRDMARVLGIERGAGVHFAIASCGGFPAAEKLPSQRIQHILCIVKEWLLLRDQGFMGV